MCINITVFTARVFTIKEEVEVLRVCMPVTGGPRRPGPGALARGDRSPRGFRVLERQ